MVQIDGAKLRELFERYQHLGAGQPPLPPEPPLNQGGGSGKSDPMEPRVAKLEAHMEHVRAELAKLSEVPVKLATLTVKVDHLPGKGFVVGAGITAVTALTALLILLQKLGVLT